MYNKYILFVFLWLTVGRLSGQDHWPVDYRVTHLVKRMPAGNQAELNRMLESLESWGEPAWNALLTGYDRDPGPYGYAVESFSRYVSVSNLKPAASWWEQAMLGRIASASDPAGFWWQQLAYVGGQQTLDSILVWQNTARQQNYLWPLAVALLHKLGVTACPDLQLEGIGLAGKLKMAAEVTLTPAQLQKVRGLLKSTDITLKRGATVALARQGRPEDVNVFSADALKGQAQGPLSYMQHLSAATAKPVLLSLTTQLLRSQASRADKIKVLSVLTDKLEQEALPLLTKAYANKTVDLPALLTLTQTIPGKQTLDGWLPFFAKASVADQAAIFTALGESRNQQHGITTVKRLLQPTLPPDVQAAGWKALEKLSGPACAQNILSQLLITAPGDRALQDIFEQILIRQADEAMLNDWFKNWNTLPIASKVLSMKLLSRRPLTSQADLVWEAINQPPSAVTEAAWRAYPALVQHKQAPALAAWMGSLPERRPLLQAAWQKIALTKEQKLGLISSVLKDGQSVMPWLPVLQSIGTHASGALLAAHTPATYQDTVAIALAAWPDLRTTPLVQQTYQQAGPEQRTAIWNTWWRTVQRLDLPTDEKRLRLESWLPRLSSHQEALGQCLQTLGQLKTYAGLWALVPYLEQGPVQQEAAIAIIRNILPANGQEEGLYGAPVHALLQQAIRVLGDQGPVQWVNPARDYLEKMPVKTDQYVSLFNGLDLSGWQGLAADPLQRMRLRADSLAMKQKLANANLTKNWRVQDGMIIFSGHGENLQTVKMYADFELLVDWRITKDGDSGIYLRGTPQVQIWDTSRVDVGAQVGSGGLYNNKLNASKPTLVADHAVGEWNTFKIRMLGEQVWVWLNGVLVTDGVTLENYWDYNLPIFPSGFIELQAHGTDLAFKNIFIKEITRINYGLTGSEQADDWESLFNGRDLEDWIGNKVDYTVQDGAIQVKPQGGGSGNLYTKEQFADFIFRFEFQLTPGANNGIGIRAPLSGDAAYAGMEIQVLDNEHEMYKNLRPYQYHGSVYGIMPAKRGALRATGEWNEEEIYVKGSYIRVTVNGVVINEGDFMAAAQPHGTMDHQQHTGLERKQGYIGFLGHGDVLRFRNIRVKRLN